MYLIITFISHRTNALISSESKCSEILTHIFSSICDSLFCNHFSKVWKRHSIMSNYIIVSLSLREIRAFVIGDNFVARNKLTNCKRQLWGLSKIAWFVQLLSAINPSTRLPDQEPNPDRAMCLDIDFIKYWFSRGCGFEAEYMNVDGKT